MKLWPFVSRAEHAAVLADRERLRGERNQFEKDRDTQTAVARTAATKYADLFDKYTATVIVNNHLTEDLKEAKEQLAKSMTVEGALARQIHDMAQPVEPTDAYMDQLNQLIRERDAEKARADLVHADLTPAEQIGRAHV